jgi:hypothetical protein
METKIKSGQSCLVDTEPRVDRPERWEKAVMLEPNMRGDGSLVSIKGVAGFYPNKLIKAKK